MAEDKKEDKASAYNEAVKKIGRLARLQEDANQCAKNGDWVVWKSYNSLFRNLK